MNFALLLSLLFLGVTSASARSGAMISEVPTLRNLVTERQSRFPEQDFTIADLQGMIDDVLPPFCEDFQFFTACACQTIFRFLNLPAPTGPLGLPMRLLCREGFNEPELVLNSCIRITTNNPVSVDVFTTAASTFIANCFPLFTSSSVLEFAQNFAVDFESSPARIYSGQK